MAVGINLEDRDGNHIDSTQVEADDIEAIHPGQDSRFCCLRFLSPYTATVYNEDQAAAIVEEARALLPRAKTPEQRRFLERLIELADMCANRVDSVLRTDPE